ncbi:hypothetical protein C0991_004701 [Blastosporella zonata]|nr:hypothetical protein C0991_004701 [Blastosporella zonata]
MASASLDATIGGANATLLVVYPNSTPTDEELTAELKVIQGWFSEFNNNGDINGKLPPNSTESFPATVLLATPGERVHITGRVSTAAAWELSPRTNNCCVHIYAQNDTLKDGFDSWLLKNKSTSKLSSPAVQAKVAAALANHRGVLGQGNLV